MRKAKAFAPLTDSQKALIEEWYNYAVKVSFNKHFKSIHRDDVISNAHDALISAARYYEDGKTHGGFKTFYLHWLYLVMLNSSAYRKRELKKRQLFKYQDVYYDKELIDKDLIEKVRSARVDLSDMKNEILDKYYFAGMTDYKIGVSIGITGANVFSHRMQALRVIRRKLKLK